MHKKMYGSPDEPVMNSTTATVVHVITNYLNIKLILIIVVLYEIIHCHTLKNILYYNYLYFSN